MDLTVEFAPAVKGNAGVKLFVGENEEIVVSVDRDKGLAVIERTRLGTMKFSPKFPGFATAPLPDRARQGKVSHSDRRLLGGSVRRRRRGGAHRSHLPEQTGSWRGILRRQGERPLGRGGLPDHRTPKVKAAARDLKAALVNGWSGFEIAYRFPWSAIAEARLPAGKTATRSIHSADIGKRGLYLIKAANLTALTAG